jgi:hypothetical protein
MDLVEGTSLADVAEGPYAPDGARLVRDVADAVAAVHGTSTATSNRRTCSSMPTGARTSATPARALEPAVPTT